MHIHVRDEETFVLAVQGAQNYMYSVHRDWGMHGATSCYIHFTCSLYTVLSVLHTSSLALIGHLYVLVL